jgi:hypothetical protein
VEFLVLGPVEVRSDGSLLRVGGVKQRSFLALLIASQGQALSLYPNKYADAYRYLLRMVIKPATMRGIERRFSSSVGSKGVQCFSARSRST